MTSREIPLDEIVWQSPATAAFVAGPDGVHNNSVLFFFAESPFFDRTSNNEIVRTQAQMPGRGHWMASREAFEAELRKRSGLEFMVVSSQVDYGFLDFSMSLGRWVIRKQERKKQTGMQDQVTVLATYFVIGDTIYMAPSVGKVLWAKLLSATENLNSFLSTASKLPLFTPGLGHHYIDPAAVSSKRKDISHGTSALASRAGSPGPSTAIQDDVSMADPQEQLEGAKASSAATSTAAADTQALFESFQLFSRYGNEYMDENPIVGEPGSFSFTASRPPPVKAIPKPARSLKAQSEVRQAATPQPPVASPVPTAAKAEAETTVRIPTRPASAASKPKRRKSKAPTSPSSPVSAVTTPAPS